jgi:hypothetical protein
MLTLPTAVLGTMVSAYGLHPNSLKGEGIEWLTTTIG